MWAGYVACMIKMRYAEKLKKLRGISELKGTIRVRGMCQKWGIKNRRIRGRVFPKVITVSVSSVIQTATQKWTVVSNVSQYFSSVLSYKWGLG